MNKQQKYAFFTIDVERFADAECVAKADYIHTDDMLDGLDVYLDILEKHGIKATLFALRNVAIKYKEQIKKYLKKGHRLALHGNRHVAPVHLTDDAFKAEILRAKRSLEHVFNTKILGYRAPFFGINDQKLSVLQETGLSYDASRINFSVARHTEHVDVNTFAQIFDEVYQKDSFYEFGHATQKFLNGRFPVSGGGYIRLSNWFFSKILLRRYIKKHRYYMFYLHPFELSSKKIPRIPGLKFYDRMYLGYGFLSFRYKIEYIIKQLKKEGYTFITFEEAVEKGILKETE